MPVFHCARLCQVIYHRYRSLCVTNGCGSWNNSQPDQKMAVCDLSWLFFSSVASAWAGEARVWGSVCLSLVWDFHHTAFTRPCYYLSKPLPRLWEPAPGNSSTTENLTATLSVSLVKREQHHHAPSTVIIIIIIMWWPGQSAAHGPHVDHLLSHISWVLVSQTVLSKTDQSLEFLLNVEIWGKCWNNLHRRERRRFENHVPQLQ